MKQRRKKPNGARKRVPKVEQFNESPAALVPRENQRLAQILTGYGAIILESSGEHDLYIKIEYEGEWITVIHESVDSVGGSISHCVHPLGIQEEIRRERKEFAF